MKTENAQTHSWRRQGAPDGHVGRQYTTKKLVTVVLKTKYSSNT